MTIWRKHRLSLASFLRCLLTKKKHEISHFTGRTYSRQHFVRNKTSDLSVSSLRSLLFLKRSKEEDEPHLLSPFSQETTKRPQRRRAKRDLRAEPHRASTFLICFSVQSARLPTSRTRAPTPRTERGIQLTWESISRHKTFLDTSTSTTEPEMELPGSET